MERNRVKKSPGYFSDSDDSGYNEAEDDDFDAEKAAADEDLSTSEDEAQPTKKRKAQADDELDSGDEATIQDRNSRKKRRQDDGSGAEEDKIKTRSQHLAEKVERRQRKRAGGEVTVDVDTLWHELSNLPIGMSTARSFETAPITNEPERRPEEYITIKRAIKFAGQITEIEEEVLRTSSEAQKFLAEQEKAEIEVQEQEGADRLNRPLRRFSVFEPNPYGLVKGVAPEKQRRKAPSKLDMAMAEKRAEDDRKRKAEKLTTMQKTALDWKGFVIEQGLGDELNEYGKSKKGFLAREQFLDKVAGVKDIARKTARLKVT